MIASSELTTGSVKLKVHGMRFRAKFELSLVGAGFELGSWEAMPSADSEDDWIASRYPVNYS